MKTLWIVILAMIGLNAYAQETGKVPREEVDLRQAENAVLGYFMVALNPESRNLYPQNDYVSIYADRADLGIALIASRNSKRSLKRLVGLLRYRLDGALAESFNCDYLDKGHNLLPYLSAVKPAALNQQCIDEVAHFKQRNKGLFDKLAAGDICSKTASIKSRVGEMISAINHGARCD